MFPAQEVTMAQNGVSNMMKFDMGPLGPQILA